MAREQVVKAFKQFDADGDGTISRTELGAVLRAIDAGLRGSDVDKILQVADTNGDGIIQYEEFLNWAFGDAGRQMVAAALDTHRVKSLGEIRWQDHVPLPPQYQSRGATVPQTESRAMTLKQLLDFGELAQAILEKIEVRDPCENPDFNVGRITMRNANLYHLNDLLVMPLTKPFRCSFMELVADGKAQDPEWFISHWWGTPFADSLRMLKFHAKVRMLLLTACYWMCTFANNQHDLGELAAEHVLDTPFAKAIMMHACSGTIALMTERSAMPFTRIWCILEDYVSLVTAKASKTRTHLLDVASIIPDGSQQILCRGARYNTRCAALLTDRGDGTFNDEGGDNADIGQVGCWFPAAVSLRAIDVDVRHANASNASDKTNILRLIGNDSENVNFALRSKFAPAALYNLSCTADTDSERLRWLLQDSGLLGDPDRVREAIDESGSLAGACQYGAATNNGNHRWLHAACVLLEARADPHAPDKVAGKSAVEYAISTSNCLAFAKLLEAGADLSKPDCRGKPLIDFASEQDNDGLWDVLAEHGFGRREIEAESMKDGPPVGSVLVAKQRLPVFASPFSGSVLRTLSPGNAVRTKGVAVVVDGYNMAPIEPKGAVQLGAPRFDVGPVVAHALVEDGPALGSTLTAKQDVRIFASPTEGRTIGTVKSGSSVKTSDWAVHIDGYSMAPIQPEGAVQLGKSRFDVSPPLPGNAAKDGPPVGSLLTAKQAMKIFASPWEGKTIGDVAAGSYCRTDGWALVVDGYTMVPIEPEGAVQLGSSRFDVGPVLDGPVSRLSPPVGATLLALADVTVFASPASRKSIGKVTAGSKVTTAGVGVEIDGYQMVPIEPQGAVQLGATRFEVV